jgi:hypothetical protein
METNSAVYERLAKIEQILAVILAAELGRPDSEREIRSFLQASRQRDDEALPDVLRELAEAVDARRTRMFAGLDPDELRQLLHRVAARQDEVNDGIRRVQADMERQRQENERYRYQVEVLGAEIARTRSEEIAPMAGDVERIGLQVDALTSAVSLGISASDVPLRHVIPIRVYLAEGSGSSVERASGAAQRLVDDLGFHVARDLGEERGSWFKSWFARSEEFITQQEVQDRVKKLERAAELEFIAKRQAEADRNHAEGLASLIKALEHESNACVQAGAFLLVKTTDQAGRSTIVTRTLTQKELAIIERRPSLLRDPWCILDILGISDRDAPSHAETLQLAEHTDE